MLSPYMSPVERLWFYSLRILCGLVLLFLVLPVLVIVPLSFNSGTFLVYPLQGFSLRWYADFFQSAEWMRSLTNSMIVAPAATLLAMVFGTLAAIGLTRGEFRGKALVMSLMISPMVVDVYKRQWRRSAIPRISFPARCSPAESASSSGPRCLPTTPARLRAARRAGRISGT